MFPSGEASPFGEHERGSEDEGERVEEEQEHECGDDDAADGVAHGGLGEVDRVERLEVPLLKSDCSKSRVR